MLAQVREVASRYLVICLRLVWCIIRTLLVVLNNLYCIPTYVSWLIILSPLESINPQVYYEVEGILFHWLLSMVAFWSYSAGYNIVETGDSIEEILHNASLVIANHQSTSDVPLMMAAFNTRPGLLSNLNWIMDKLFKYTNFGIVSAYHGDFFICAGRDKREASIRELGQYLKQVYIPRRRKWLVLFPEGGFLRKRRLASQMYGDKCGLPRLEHVTLPRMGAVQVIMETAGPKPLASGDRADPSDVPNNNLELRSGYLSHIVDLTIAYPKGNPLSLLDVITGYASPCAVRFHYRVYNVKDVPTEKLQDWLYDRYYEKEKMLEHYYETGTWKQYDLLTSSSTTTSSSSPPSSKELEEERTTNKDGVLISGGKFSAVKNGGQMLEQDLLRTLLLHAFFLCSTYFHLSIIMLVIQCTLRLFQ